MPKSNTWIHHTNTNTARTAVRAFSSSTSSVNPLSSRSRVSSNWLSGLSSCSERVRPRVTAEEKSVGKHYQNNQSKAHPLLFTDLDCEALHERGSKLALAAAALEHARERVEEALAPGT